MPQGFAQPQQRVCSMRSWSLVDFWSWGETRRAEELRRRNEELNRLKVSRGQMTEQQAAAQEDRFNAEDPSTWDRQMAEEFMAGAGEGLATMPERFRNALTSAAGWSLSFVPWWAWAGGIVAVAAWLGVFDGLKGSLSRRGR